MRRVGIDVGGTFTDLVFYDDEVGISRCKVPTDAKHPEQGALDALRKAEIDLDQVDLLLHGTTLVTNLLLMRTGARVGLLTTSGFEDLLDIGFTYRDRPYDLQWEASDCLVPGPLRYGVRERIGADGEPVVALDRDGVRSGIRALVEMGAETIAVCYLHAHINPEHERITATLVREVVPQLPVSISSEVDPQVREYPRLSTTVLNAYAYPRTAEYIGELTKHTRDADQLLLMHSGGGVIPVDTARSFPIYLARSGPAGGVTGASYIARQKGLNDVICLDMGGTSCEASVIRNGEAERTDTVWVDWMVPARVQALDVTSIGAGGGSVAWVDSGGQLQVGPRSAGADPGPACYGRGGQEPTITDANLLLGILNADYFLGGAVAIDGAASERTLARVGERLGTSAREVARGVYRVVTANLADAVREVTVQRGIDPREFTLVAFGGAGGQHAALVAEELGIERVLFPAYASVLSAYGLVSADLVYPASRSYGGHLEAIDFDELITSFNKLGERACAGLASHSVVDGDEPRTTWLADLRYEGQLHEVRVSVEQHGLSPQALASAFERSHESLYGSTAKSPIEVISVHAVATQELPKPSGLVEAGPAARGGERADAGGTRPVTLFDDQEYTVVHRRELIAGSSLEPESIVEDVDSTVLIPAYWRGRVEQDGELIIEREAPDHR